MKYWLFCTVWLWSQLPSTALADHSVLLGDTRVTIHVSGRAGGLTYFVPHDSENTAVAAANSVIAKSGGWLIELQHGGARNIRFVLHGRAYEFDPNRMFSDAGIRATLRREGAGNYSLAAHRMIAGFARDVLGEIAQHRQLHAPLVALHNNTNGAFSITSYQTGNLQPEACQVTRNSKADPDDFFLVTNIQQYAALANLQQNVVMQSPTPTDDGSLSVFAAKAGIAYVNVEAQAGHLSIQIAMLKALLPH